MKNNFIKSENYTKWAIRKVSVGVVSAAIASGIFVIVGGGEAHASDKQLDKAPIVETVKSQADENVVTKPTEKVEAVESTTVKPKEVDKTVEQPVIGTDREAKPEAIDNNILSLAKDTADAPKPEMEAPDMTTHKTTKEEVVKGVKENTKDTVDVPAKYLDKANFPGPFTAGVNKVIPYHLFAGDGMLTRLILNSSDKAPWSDNGTAKNPALPPVENLTEGLYFYEVDLAGTEGKQDAALLDALKANGTKSYKATIKVYGEKDGKADLTNIVATKDITVNLNNLTKKEEVVKGVKENTKDTIDVPAKYLDKANFPGPFTAGVNQVIPYHLFAGDGMLTRLILKASDKAPWSDNGSAKNPALPPVANLGHGLYFYEVDLEGTEGKQDAALLDALKANGTRSYKATIKVYGEKDGKADLTNLVATKDVTVNLNNLTTKEEVVKGVMDNTKDTVDVPAKYLDKANFPGPFTAGVNQVIPYHLFAGDGMLTRLILKASDKAPWSDNGSAKNPALPPVANLGHGLYFYEVDLEGTKGKSDKELLDLLKANGTRSYKATIKVYGEKDGKADLTNLVATKELTINLHKEDMSMNTEPMMPGNMDMKHRPMNMNKSESMMKDNMVMDNNMQMKDSVNHGMMNKAMLPKTSAAPEGTATSTSTSTTGIVGLIIASLLSLLGFRRKNEID